MQVRYQEYLYMRSAVVHCSYVSNEARRISVYRRRAFRGSSGQHVIQTDHSKALVVDTAMYCRCRFPGLFTGTLRSDLLCLHTGDPDVPANRCHDSLVGRLGHEPQLYYQEGGGDGLHEGGEAIPTVVHELTKTPRQPVTHSS